MENKEKWIVIIRGNQKEEKEWLKDQNSQELKISSQNMESLFQNTSNLEYKVYEKNGKLFLIKRSDTILENSTDIKQNNKAVSQCVPELIKYLCNQLNTSKENIEWLVIFHTEYIEPVPGVNITNYTIGGSESPAKQRGRILVEMINKLFKCETDVNAIYKEIKKNLITEEDKVIKARRILSLLHHRIAHLFLPMDIDVMGIFEVWKDKDKNTAVEYLEDVLNDKNSETYYRQKLVDLQYIIAGDKVKFNEAEEDKIKGLNGNPYLLAEGKSIYDLILELGEKKKDEILKSDEWENLLKHCGLKPQEISFIPEDSPILQFMCFMDSKIKKRKNNSIKETDVEEIINFNPNGKSLNENELWFQKWFCELDKLLNKLRKII